MNCNKIVNEMNEFCSTWNSYLSKTPVDENVLKNTKELLINLRTKAEREKIVNTRKIFDDKMCNFKRNTEILRSDIIGDLSLHETIKSKLSNQL